MSMYERRDGPTPFGGDYSVLYYLNKKYEPVDSSVATHGAIREYKADGTCINEIRGYLHRSEDTQTEDEDTQTEDEDTQTEDEDTQTEDEDTQTGDSIYDIIAAFLEKNERGT